MADDGDAKAMVAPDATRGRQFLMVEDSIALFDTARLEHMQRIASAMAVASLTPDCLRGVYVKQTVNGREEQVLVEYPMQTIVSNCLMIVEQAMRWNMSPFAVAQSVSIVRGKLMYEGKLVAAVLQGRLKTDLKFQYGKYDPRTELVDLSVQGEGDFLGVIVSDSDDPERAIHGSVGIWKTTGDKSPWRPGALKRQLRYRGTREWSRAYEPGVMLGVITDDEISDLTERRFAHALPSRSEAEPTALSSAAFGEPKRSKKRSEPKAQAAPPTEVAEVAEETPFDDDADEADEADPDIHDGGPEADSYFEEIIDETEATETFDAQPRADPSPVAEPSPPPTTIRDRTPEEQAYHDAFVDFVGKQDSWLQIKPAILKLRADPRFGNLPLLLRRETLLAALERVRALKDPVSPEEDPAFYRVWIWDSLPEAIEATFKRLIRSQAFQKLTERERDEIADETEFAK